LMMRPVWGDIVIGPLLGDFAVDGGELWEGMGWVLRGCCNVRGGSLNFAMPMGRCDGQ